MITKKDIDRDSTYYDNQNAKSNCPHCDSINTYYYRNTLFCQDCGREHLLHKLDKEKMRRLLKTASLLGIVLTGLFYYFY